MDGKELLRRKPRSRCGPRLPSEALRFSSATDIPLEEVATLFRCGNCLEAPIEPPVYTCRNGHLSCGYCYRRLCRDCYKCKEPLLGRNQVVEEVMKSLPYRTCKALSGSDLLLRQSMSEQSLQMTLQDPSLLEKLEKGRKGVESQEKLTKSETKGNFQNEKRETELKSTSTSNCSIGSGDSLHTRPSSRPVACPFPCGRLVTCSGLLPHFEFNHPNAILYKVTKNCDINFKIPYDDIKYTDEDEGRCVVIFVVKIDDTEDDGEEFNKPADLLRVTRGSQEITRRGYFVTLLSAARLPNAVGADSWFLAAWATALYDFAPITYRLRASTSDGKHHFSYRGPPASLHKDHRPGRVFQRGESLTVPPALLHDFHGPGRTLDLTIKFYSDLPFPFVPSTPTFHWTPDTQGMIL